MSLNIATIMAQSVLNFSYPTANNRNGLSAHFNKSSTSTADLNQLYSKVVENNHTITVTIGNNSLTFLPEENNLISPDYTLIVAGNEGRKVFHNPSVRTYFGVAEGEAASMSLTLDRNFLNMTIHADGKEYYIEQQRIFDRSSDVDQLVLYNAKDVVSDGNFTCGMDDVKKYRVEGNTSLETRTGQCKLVSLAIAADVTMYNKYGNSVPNVENHNISVMNNVAFNYRHEFLENIEFTIAGQYISTSMANDPLDPVTSSTNINTVLNAFSKWSDNGGFGFTHNLAQFWTNRDFGGPVGLAWVDVICDGNYYSSHVLQDFSDNAAELRVMTAHEIGHNFGADHDAAGSPFIMAPVVNITDDWSSASKTAINATIPTYTCLGDCTGPVSAYFVSAPGALCNSGDVLFKDKSVNGKTRTWTFAGGTPSTSTVQQPTVNYSAVGTYEATITSETSSYTITNAVIVTSPPPLNTGSCPIPTNPPGNAGLKGLSLSNLTSSSGNGIEDGSIYVDRSCAKIATLKPSAEYTISFNVGDCSSNPIIFEIIRAYIDYNKDGDFSDSGENIVNSGGTGYCGTMSFTFTTPATPTENTLLRLRVLTSTSYTNDPCANITNGQVEDFSVVFKQDIPLPVNLISFTGHKEKEMNVLNWTTADEKNLDRFIVERSTDGEHFMEIGYQKASNLTTGKYTFFDKVAEKGRQYYYRLNILDNFGLDTYSSIVSLSLDRINMIVDRLTSMVKAQDGLKCNIYVQQVTNATFYLHDVMGNQIMSRQVMLYPGKNSVHQNLGNLIPGIYFFNIRDNSGNGYNEKIVITE
ncbi:MAG: hypothetical protein J5I59_13555 [Saprospiraceae bacterium]|nr:hypothetical protein [Saprospiraceae bacterium]